MKKISVDSYATAFVSALKGTGSKEKILEKFIETIRRHNNWSRRHQILAACEKKWRRAEGKSLVIIESARELSTVQRTQLLAQFKNKNHDVEYTINPSLIAGVKILINDEKQLDGSLNNKLRKIFAEV